MLDDGHVQFRSFWRPESPHAADWSYGVAGAACPSFSSSSSSSSVSNSTTNGTHGVVAYIADVVNPGFYPDSSTSNALRWDAGYARQWVLDAVRDGVPKSTLIVGTHGSARLGGVSNGAALEVVAGAVGVVYPDIGVESFALGERCR